MTSRARVALGWLAVVGVALGCVATRLSVNADFAAFLPSATTAQRRFLVSELKEGVASRLLLIELSGGTAERLADVGTTLARKLRADGRFRYVNNGDAEFGHGELDALRAHRYLLSDAVEPRRFTAEGLRAALAERVRALSVGATPFENALLPEDPTGETLHLVDRLTPATQPRREQGAWFDPSGARALLLAETRAPGSDLDGQADAIAALERAFAAAKGDGDEELRYSSPGAMAAMSRTLIAADASRLAIVSTALIVALLGFVYRSPAVVLLCALPAVTGLLVGAAAVDAAFGGIHAITLGFGATLLGEAVDYPAYLLTQMRPDESAPAALARLGGTLAMAVLTTAAAAVALLLTDFPGLAQLGLLTMVGVSGAGMVTAWVLPHWVPDGWHARLARPGARAWRSLPPGRARVALAAILVAGLLAFASGKPWWDDDLANMNPLPADLRQRDRELRAALRAPEVGYMLLVDGATREDALESAEQLRPALERAVASRALGAFELVSDYLPSQAAQRRRQAVLPDAAELRARFADAASGLPIRVEAFEPFFAAVERARAAPPVDASYLAGTALGLKLEGLLRPDGERWYVVVPLAGVASADGARRAVDQAAVAGVQWVDLRETSRDMMGAFRANALRAFGLGTLLILGVLSVGLRGARAAARVALPVAAAVVATAGAMVALGQPLTVFHLVALMLVAGIGTNYSLFLRRGAAAGDPPATIVRSLAVVGGTTLCAFGTLATSQAPVLRAIGLTVTLGVVLCLALLALLPVIRPLPPHPA